jgi:hypothetical protein
MRYLKMTAIGAVGMLLAVATTAAIADEVVVLNKKAWKQGDARGYWITYKHNGKAGKAKVSCRFGYRPVFVIDGLDRGDGVKVDIDVGSENGNEITDVVTPGYMNWAIDIWKKTCR